MKTAFAYARYSSDNQRQESIDAQIRAIKEYCFKKQIVLKHIFTDEAVSATTDQRDGFLQMIEQAKESQVDYVIVHKLDRFARNRYDSAFYRHELEKTGVKVLSVLEQLDGSPESIILESVLEGMAEYYSKNLAREVRKGQNENALHAVHNGGTPPLGYDLTPDRKHYQINEVEAQAVRRIFSEYVSGYGYGLICDHLNKEGYKTKAGRPFGKNSIGEILRNEKYVGRYVWNKRVSKKKGNHAYKPDDQIIRIDGAVPAIIDEETWNKTQSILSSRKQRPRLERSHRYLLTGKLICGQCGRAYAGGGFVGGRGQKKYHQYCCTGRKAHTGCMGKGIQSQALEDCVIEEIKSVLSEDMIRQISGKVCDEIKSSCVGNQELKKSLKIKLESFQQRIGKTWELYYSNLLPMEQVSKQIELLEKEKAECQAQFDSIPQSSEQKESINDIVSYLQHCRRKLENASDDVKQEIINAFVKQIIIYDDSVKMEIRVGTKASADSVGTIAKVGGDEGSRTPVRKSLALDFFERSRLF